MSLKRSDLLLCLDFDTTLVSGGVTYLKDFSPQACHLSLAAATAPTRTVSADGVGYTFNGTTNFLGFDATTAARFWGALVDGHTDYTFICKAYFRAPAIGDRIFDASNGAGTAGFLFQTSAAGAERLRVGIYSPAFVSYGDAADVPCTGRTRVAVWSVRFNPGAAATPIFRLYDGGRTVAGVAGGTGIPVAFDRTVLPRVGSTVGGANYFDGRLYYLALAKALPTPDEATEISSLLLDNRKPWVG